MGHTCGFLCLKGEPIITLGPHCKIKQKHISFFKQIKISNKFRNDLRRVNKRMKRFLDFTLKRAYC